jgi:predicted nucleotidyltransferase
MPQQTELQKFETIAANRADAARLQARQRAVRVTEFLAERGITVLVTGSLAKGGFGITSDVDFLVTDCPKALKYTIEADVEDCMGPIPFDVIYLDEIRPERISHFTREAVDARTLR